MARSTIKGLLLALSVLLLGMWFSREGSVLKVMLFASLSVLLMVGVVNRFVKGSSNEIFISAFLLGFAETYHFMISPSVSWLPELWPNAKLFFGVAVLVRAVIYLLHLTKLLPESVVGVLAIE